MGRQRARGRVGTAGTAAIEFALVLPVLAALVVGTIEVGFLILSQASMNATMARVPDQVRRAADVADLTERLDTLAGLPLGLGLAAVAFDPVEELCVCPAQAASFRDEDVAQDCSDPCDAGDAALRLYTVTARVTVPSVIPDADFGVRSASAQLTVPGR